MYWTTKWENIWKFINQYIYQLNGDYIFQLPLNLKKNKKRYKNVWGGALVGANMGRKQMLYGLACPWCWTIR